MWECVCGRLLVYGWKSVWECGWVDVGWYVGRVCGGCGGHCGSSGTGDTVVCSVGDVALECTCKRVYVCGGWRYNTEVGMTTEQVC